MAISATQCAQSNHAKKAHEFMKAYSSVNPHAYSNVGYLAGYYGEETRKRIYDWFQTAHPIFGTSTPTADEALRAGQQLANGRA
jgi:hypothetical protein